MYRPALRAASIQQFARLPPRLRDARRLISTAPPHHKSRSWKSSAARWGLAGALVYYYNTTNVFAEEPSYITTPPNPSQESEPLQTVASISEERKAQSRSQLLSQTQQSQTTTYAAPDDETPAPGSPEELEEEASQEGAFNEETGEINWDCPCLGGMAHGPCGDQFRAAFSCFVFSKEEPKGVDCIEHFKAMQNCFREHPDIYGAELDDDEDGAAEGQEGQPAALATEATAQPGGAQPAISGQHARSNVSQPSPPPDLSVATTSERGEQSNPLGKVGQDHVSSADKDEEARVPKASHDAR